MRRFARCRWLYGRCVKLDPFCDVGRGVAVEGPIKIFGYVADVRRREDVLQLPERMVGLQRFDVEYINGGTSDLTRLQSFNQSRLVDDRSTRCVDESRRRLHQGELGCPDQLFGTTAQDQMDGHDVGFAEQRLLVDEDSTRGAGLLLGEVLAPGDHLHAEGDTDARDPPSDIAQPGDAYALASQVC